MFEESQNLQNSELFRELHKSISEVLDFTRKKKWRIANVLLNFFKKRQSDFTYVTKTRKELLAIIHDFDNE